MKIQWFRRFEITDYPDADQWWNRAIDPINRQFETLSNAVDGRLTFGDNILSEIREVELQEAVDDNLEPIWTTAIKVDESIIPIGVLMVWTDYFETSSMVWQRKQQGNVVDIRVRWATEPNRPPAARFLILGG